MTRLRSSSFGKLRCRYRLACDNRPHGKSVNPAGSFGHCRPGAGARSMAREPRDRPDRLTYRRGARHIPYRLARDPESRRPAHGNRRQDNE
ncbi:hypothetical protein CO2235_30099 [Cupriavidus oxalaticus]|uniref:Uncharacterized protein n=1 Tax=Cupriavidus oxalaticus TaxID=96344 RepID=A0A375G7D5_9BURK|nr:hypothetical protein CO2235_30099 [Cupriavidus oxalaticus]